MSARAFAVYGFPGGRDTFGATGIDDDNVTLAARCVSRYCPDAMEAHERLDMLGLLPVTGRKLDTARDRCGRCGYLYGSANHKILCRGAA